LRTAAACATIAPPGGHRRRGGHEFYKAPPTYPVKYANWVSVIWLLGGIVLTVFLVRFRRDKLRDIDRVYVEDDSRSPAGRSG
jgi:hypothetical protein